MDSSVKIIKRILSDGRPYVPSFMVLGALALLMVPVEVYLLLLSRRLIDKGFVIRDWEAIQGILLTLIVLFMIRSLLDYITAFSSTKLQLRINRKFQSNLFSHMIHLPMGFFISQPTGRLMSRLLDDAPRFSSILNTLFGQAVLTPLKIIVLLLFLLYLNFHLCALMLISTFFSFLIIYRVGNRMRQLSKEIQDKNAGLYSFVEQVFPNMELIKSRITEINTSGRFERKIDELIVLSLRVLNLSLISSPVMQGLKYLGLGTVFVYGGWMISKGYISMGTLTIFLGATYLAFNTVSSLNSAYSTFKENLARMEVIYGILDTYPERSLAVKSEVTPGSMDRIRFNDVSFGYGSEGQIIKNISFNITPGETLGITGQSGSGKTTLVRLLLRLYEPDSGEIRFGEKPIKELPLDVLRSSIGVAFQDNFILNTTIRKNISYGYDDIPMERVITAARVSRAHNFIGSLPNGYETLQGEGGKRLSGGQRQRIAIARAILTEPEILILDEATSYVEIEQEKLILDNIKRIRRRKITIIISHRISAIRQTDRIVTLDNGMIIENGFHFLSSNHQGAGLV